MVDEAQTRFIVRQAKALADDLLGPVSVAMHEGTLMVHHEVHNTIWPLHYGSEVFEKAIELQLIAPVTLTGTINGDAVQWYMKVQNVSDIG